MRLTQEKINAIELLTGYKYDEEYEDFTKDYSGNKIILNIFIPMNQIEHTDSEGMSMGIPFEWLKPLSEILAIPQDKSEFKTVIKFV